MVFLFVTEIHKGINSTYTYKIQYFGCLKILKNKRQNTTMTPKKLNGDIAFKFKLHVNERRCEK